jgi:hypothetical protein
VPQWPFFRKTKTVQVVPLCLVSISRRTEQVRVRHAKKRGLRNSLGCSKRETWAHRFCIYDGGNARLGLACAILANLSIAPANKSSLLRWMHAVLACSSYIIRPLCCRRHRLYHSILRHSHTPGNIRIKQRGSFDCDTAYSSDIARLQE